ncbi:hypothetical protein [Butyrivibrio sp.]|uniref:hypothetical protein n=1 Tax=Butyrivibrio sp. TaxID=28121 RepID=UPI0025B808F5|nr:hypothetical protein [Butyrivibrio sp.]MBQ7430263.1 hypothetical protein [Butyrivibrio sp.]MBQ9303437.1 hypothetical protein [Butyrivibrio sp.]
MAEDSFGKAIATLFLILGIAFFPLLLMQNNVDSMSRAAAEEAVQDFADNARSTGYITQADYEVLRAKLVATGYSYHVQMLHRSKTVVPDSDMDEGYRTSYKAYNFEDIVAYWEENDGVYPMKNGDFFQILMTSSTPTKASSMLGMLYGNSGTIQSIPAGGMVGNQKN